MDPQADGWERAIGVDELIEDRPSRVRVADTDVMVLKHGEAVYAVAARCTHQGAPLDRGVVRVSESDPSVTCPAHGSVFSLIDGHVRRGPASQPILAFEARVVDGVVEIRPRG